MPFFIAGLWLCNSPFGVVHGFKMSGAQHIAAIQDQDRQTPTVNIAEHGIMPDTGKDVLEQVQELIDKVGRQGGGCIFFRLVRLCLPFQFATGRLKKFLL